MRKSHRHGFTLIELALVIVIIGLIIGGILVGQSMIRAAQIRSVATQFQKFATATQNFKDKYQALPGDMVDATTIWGTAAAGAACITTASTGSSATCNGNGDGLIILSTNSAEQFRFWQQLVNAGFLEGSYSGVSVAGYSNSWDATNAPISKIPTGLWAIYSWGAVTGNISYFDGTYNNTLEIGGYFATSDPLAVLIKPDEAYNIDTKLDDGMPGTGKVRVRSRGGLSNCTTTSTTTAYAATYLLTGTTVACGLLFTNWF